MTTDIDKAKLFVGGISRETSEEALKTHFSKYGTVCGSLVAKEKFTRNPRGFGFVWFSDPIFADKALNDSHVILGRTVEVKKAIPRNEQLQNHQHQQLIPNQQNNIGNSDNSFRTKKIFVGGLSSSLTREQFKNYFSRFGEIVDVVVMQDSSTNRPRGFGFVTFDSEESVDKVILNSFHELNGRMVEVKRAVPKEEINGTNNGIRCPWPSPRSFYHENYFPYGQGNGIHPGYSPIPWSNNVGWYSYGGYPIGYGRHDNGVTGIFPRGPLSSPVMVGPMVCPLPYNSPIFPTYANGYFSVRGLMPTENGKLTKSYGADGCQQFNGV